MPWPTKRELEDKDVLFLSELLNVISPILVAKLQQEKFRQRRGLPIDKEPAAVYTDSD